MADLTRHPSAPRKTPPPTRPVNTWPISFCGRCHEIRAAVFVPAGFMKLSAQCRTCGCDSEFAPVNCRRAQDILGDRWQPAFDAAIREAIEVAKTESMTPRMTATDIATLSLLGLLGAIVLGTIGWWLVGQFAPHMG